MNQPTKNQLKDQLALAADALIREREEVAANYERIANLTLAGWRPMPDNLWAWHRPDPRPWWLRWLP